MTDLEKQKLGKTLWAIADQLRGAMNADDSDLKIESKLADSKSRLLLER
jgi:hypothetical protein